MKKNENVDLLETQESFTIPSCFHMAAASTGYYELSFFLSSIAFEGKILIS